MTKTYPGNTDTDHWMEWLQEANDRMQSAINVWKYESDAEFPVVKMDEAILALERARRQYVGVNEVSDTIDVHEFHEWVHCPENSDHETSVNQFVRDGGSTIKIVLKCRQCGEAFTIRP